VELIISQGAKCIYGGNLSKPTYYDPTVLINVTPEMDVAKNMEIFGPVIPILGFDTEKDVVALSNNTFYGLNVGVFTGDMKRAFRVASLLECGSVVINGSGNYRNIDQPHGGRK
jgi:succinate-semialdehyde dehydrogenase/glutarate-semialdehyde dehydrogenase